MTLQLTVGVEVAADAQAVWRTLTDWAGQSRWIPLTTVVVVSGHDTGLGVRAEALSGFWLGRLPLGLLDRFVVTGWTAPGTTTGELEVLHLGPCFTGVGVFRVQPVGPGRSRVTATEVFSLPGGAPVEAVVRLALPGMRMGLRASLRALARIVQA